MSTTNAKHTPGPWKANRDGKVYSEIATEWNRTFNAELPAYVASVGGPDYMANAVLIAQAPTMAARIAELESQLAAVTAQRDQCAEALAGALKSPWFASVGADTSPEADAMRAAVAACGGAL